MSPTKLFALLNMLIQEVEKIKKCTALDIKFNHTNARLIVHGIIVNDGLLGMLMFRHCSQVE